MKLILKLDHLSKRFVTVVVLRCLICICELMVNTEPSCSKERKIVTNYEIANYLKYHS